MSGFKGPDHGWQGGGRFRVARIDGLLLVRFQLLTTNTGKLKADMGSFFRKDYRGCRADFRPYDVRIWLSAAPNARIDVDNVAKACLDALTGVVWRDDRQVVRLAVEKSSGDRSAVVLAVKPCDRPTGDETLRRLIEAADNAP